MLSKNILYYGKNDPQPEVTSLSAGPLTMIYQDGDLRYIKYGQHEILRRVYIALRDHNWDTVLPNLSNVQMDIGSDSFEIQYDVENKQGDIDFFWQGKISGNDQGTITFTMRGVARSTFRRNRIGFCILHPMDCAGVACDIEHVDGSIEPSKFPQAIGPQLKLDGIIHPVHPFDNMRSMTYEVAPGMRAQIRYEGEIFEMEDQRNWTDASYKTYGTPLELPFPVEVPQGTELVQTVTVQLLEPLPNSAETLGTAAESLTFTVGNEALHEVPEIGLGTASHDQPLSEKELARLNALNIAHLRVDLHLAHNDWEEKLRQAMVEAKHLGISLEVALILSDNAEQELQAFTNSLTEIKPPISRWLVFYENEKSTTEQWIVLARQYLETYDPAVKIGSGTNVFFTELNCNRPPIHAMDLVCYSINPQVHAFDNLSLMETLAAQATTVESTRLFSGDLPIAVTPVTLQMRFNPNATGPEPTPAPGELPAQVDVRQMSLFGAGWTTGSLRYLLSSDIQSVTYFETTGWRGVMETEAGSPLPEQFHSIAGAVYPLYHVLADVGEFAGGEILSTRSSSPLMIDGLAICHSSKTRLLLANLTGEPQQVTISNLAKQVKVRSLDESNVLNAMQSPEEYRAQDGKRYETQDGQLTIDLLPFAVVRIDF